MNDDYKYENRGPSGCVYMLISATISLTIILTVGWLGSSMISDFEDFDRVAREAETVRILATAPESCP